MSTSLLLLAPIMVSVAFADYSITRYCTSLQGTQDSQGCTTTGSPSCYAQPSGNLGGVTLSFDVATDTASLHCCGSWYYTMTLNGNGGSSGWTGCYKSSGDWQVVSAEKLTYNPSTNTITHNNVQGCQLSGSSCCWANAVGGLGGGTLCFYQTGSDFGGPQFSLNAPSSTGSGPGLDYSVDGTYSNGQYVGSFDATPGKFSDECIYVYPQALGNATVHV